MFYLLITCLVFAVAIAVNSASVYIQKHHHFYDQYSHGWLWHSLVIIPAWALFIYLSEQLNNHTRLAFTSIKWLGLILLVAAISLFIFALRQIGTQALTNGNLFSQGKSSHTGLYRLLRNPIYDSYCLAFVGLGVYYGNWSYLVLAAECYIGLNLIEANIEAPNV